MSLSIFLTLISSQTYEEELTIECMTHYLKTRDISEDLVSYVSDYKGSFLNCESAVKSKLAVIYTNLRSKLRSDRKRRPFLECVMRNLEEDDETYEILVLRETAVEMMSGWRFWNYYAKQSRIEELQKQQDQVVAKAVLNCKGHIEFGNIFNDINDKTRTWDRNGEQEYCIRKYLEDKKLINPNLYEYTLNPRSVRKEVVNCADVLQNVFDGIYQDLDKSECIIKVYRDNFYADYILKAELLSKLKLDRSDKSKERQNFINSMVDITYDTKNC